MDRAQGPQAVPRFIENLAQKILAGDTDAIGLMATPRQQLMGGNSTSSPPTAIKAEYYRYSFSRWEDLRDRGQWWTRQPIPDCPPQIILPKAQQAVREGSTYRSWSLGSSALGLQTAIAALLTTGEGHGLVARCRYAIVGSAFALSFIMILTAEYSTAECDVVHLGWFKTQAAVILQSTAKTTYTALHDVIGKAVFTLIVVLLGGPLLVPFRRPTLRLGDLVLLCCGVGLVSFTAVWDDVNLNL